MEGHQDLKSVQPACSSHLEWVCSFPHVSERNINVSREKRLIRTTLYVAAQLRTDSGSIYWAVIVELDMWIDSKCTCWSHECLNVWLIPRRLLQILSSHSRDRSFCTGWSSVRIWRRAARRVDSPALWRARPFRRRGPASLKSSWSETRVSGRLASPTASVPASSPRKQRPPSGWTSGRGWSR